MKILHVIPSLSPRRGGPAVVVRTLADHQSRAGMEVHVATTDDDDRGRQRVPLGTPLFSGGATYWYFRRVTRTYESAPGLAWWLLRHTRRFDVVHIHSVFSFPATAAANIAHRNSVPYVVRPLGVLNRWGVRSGRTWAKRLSIRMIESAIFRGAAAVQFGSLAERAESEEACRARRAVVIPNPVDPSPPGDARLLRALYPAITGRRMVLFLGRLDPVKGVDALIDAFAEIHRRLPETILAIAGEGAESYVAALRQRAQDAGVARDIVWTGFLAKAGKASALANAEVFVVPSRSESFGLAAVEALAAGVPSVIGAGAGIAAEVEAAGAGLVVGPDKDELAGAVERLLQNRELALTLAARGRALVQARYSPEAVAGQVIRLYAEVGRRA